MVGMKKNNVKETLLTELGIDEREFDEKTPKQIIEQEKIKYLNANEVERGIMFGSSLTARVMQGATILSKSEDLAKAVQITSDLQDNLEGIVHVIKDRFEPIFPDFDQGAAISIGVRIRNAFNRVKKSEMALYRDGSSVWVLNYIMKGITEGKSKNKFIRNLRKNPEKLDVFKKELESYVRVRWDYEMMKEGTFRNSLTEQENKDKVTLNMEVLGMFDKNA